MITLLKIIINLIKNNDYFYLKLLLTTIMAKHTLYEYYTGLNNHEIE